jgi:hypothetical protein
VCSSDLYIARDRIDTGLYGDQVFDVNTLQPPARRPGRRDRHRGEPAPAGDVAPAMDSEPARAATIAPGAEGDSGDVTRAMDADARAAGEVPQPANNVTSFRHDGGERRNRDRRF